MDLFTIIGLLLSIFGAAYSANAALRGHYEDRIQEGARQAADRVKFIKENGTQA